MPISNGAVTTAAPNKIYSLLLLLVCLFGAIGTVWFFGDYVFEDSYITYRYADNLAQGNGFNFTPGERVLGTTTPLYTLLLAALAMIGFPLEVAADWVFAGALAVCAGLGGVILRRLGAPLSGILFAALCMAGFGDVLQFWGMETTMYVALLMGTVLALIAKKDHWAGFLVGCAFLTRYDAAMFAIPLYVFMAWRDRRIPWRSGGIALAVVAPWLIFATFYFGSPLPNTLSAKTGSTGFLEYLQRSGLRVWNLAWRPLGVPYAQIEVWTGMVKWLNVLTLIGCLFGLARLRKPVLGVLMLLIYPVALWSGYSYIGPHLNFGWYLIPAAYFLLLFALYGWAGVLGRVALRPLALGVACLLAVSFGLRAPVLWGRMSSTLEGTSQYKQRVWAYTEIADFIKVHGLADLVLMTDEPGYLTYLSKNPAIDLAGLVSRGVFHPHNATRAVDVPGLIESRKPGLIVGRFPFTPPGYGVLYSAALGTQLLIRLEVIPEHLEGLVHGTGDPGLGRSFRVASENPFPIDIASKNMADIRANGAVMERIGYPRPMFIDDREIREEYGFLHAAPHGPLGFAETGAFPISFDWIQLRFQATHPWQTVAQLVVEGHVVFAEGGDPGADHSQFREIRWPVQEWRGKQAVVRFLCTGDNQWLAYDHLETFSESHARMVDDFEGDGLEWSPDAQVVSMQDAAARVGALGLLPMGNVLSTFGQAGAKVWQSAAFELTHDELTFLFADYSGGGALELWVDETLVNSAQGKGRRATTSVVWGVTDWKGQAATLRLIDPTPAAEAWVAVDNIRLCD